MGAESGEAEAHGHAVLHPLRSTRMVELVEERLYSSVSPFVLEVLVG